MNLRRLQLLDRRDVRELVSRSEALPAIVVHLVPPRQCRDVVYSRLSREAGQTTNRLSIQRSTARWATKTAVLMEITSYHTKLLCLDLVSSSPSRMQTHCWRQKLHYHWNDTANDYGAQPGA